jgi:hypothetical protein
MTQRILFRRGLQSEWQAANPILAEGELGLELDTTLYKIGNGIDSWNSLGYGGANVLGTPTYISSDEDNILTVGNDLKLYVPLKNSWSFYTLHWDSNPQFIANITNGTVYSYTYNSVTRYRFVPTTYDSTLDSYYSTFNGTTLSGLIVSRGQ